MSFTTEVKTEITQQPIKDCCQKAQLSALIQLNASLIIHEQQLQLLEAKLLVRDGRVLHASILGLSSGTRKGPMDSAAVPKLTLCGNWPSRHQRQSCAP